MSEPHYPCCDHCRDEESECVWDREHVWPCPVCTPENAETCYVCRVGPAVVNRRCAGCESRYFATPEKAEVPDA